MVADLDSYNYFYPDDLVALNPLESKDKEITEIYKKMVENQIKTNPSYYFWTHRRFKHEKSSLF